MITFESESSSVSVSSSVFDCFGCDDAKDDEDDEGDDAFESFFVSPPFPRTLFSSLIPLSSFVISSALSSFASLSSSLSSVKYEMSESSESLRSSLAYISTLSS